MGRRGEVGEQVELGIKANDYWRDKVLWGSSINGNDTYRIRANDNSGGTGKVQQSGNGVQT